MSQLIKIILNSVSFSYRTEYWVSNARKFCDFCKCYIADNKPSIQFHENGNKHKENVRKRLAEMQKKATKDASAAKTMENQIKKMEQAAMRAYMKDIEANPDYTSQMIKEKISSASAEPTVTDEPKKVVEKSKETVPKEKKKESAAKQWLEAKSDEGHIYYWNVETGESVWEQPKEGFVSIKDQEAPSSTKPKKTVKKKDESLKRSVHDINKEIYGRQESVKIKTEPDLNVPEPEGITIGPSPRTDPYGSWTAVVKEEHEIPDLQLPEVKYEPLQVPTLVPEERQRTFKERKAPVTTVSAGEGSEVTFKKRKFGGARNARQRALDD